MSDSEAAVSTSEAAAARSEEDGPRTVTWRGLELTIPEKPPGTLALDYAEIEAGRKEISPVVDLIKSLIGREQYTAFYEKVSADSIPFEEMPDVLSEVLSALLEPFGLSAGESEASASS